MNKIISAPLLDHDKMMRERFNHPELSLISKQERKVIANFLNHLMTNGFEISGVWDGEEFTKTSGIKDTMEIMFNLDESRIYVNRIENKEDKHNILIVFDNDPEDMIADWSLYDDDRDGFDACIWNFVHNVEKILV